MTEKSNVSKIITDAGASGGAGHDFENRVLACFVTLMHTGGKIPVLFETLFKIIPQVRRLGYNLDDFLVFVNDPQTGKEKKLACQVKLSMAITSSDVNFKECINAAWLDYNNNDLFQKGRDMIILATGPLSKNDIKGALPVLEKARLTKNVDSFRIDMNTAHYTSKLKKEKYEVMRNCIKEANNGKLPSEEEIHNFLRSVYILQFDLSSTIGVNLSLLCSHLSQYCDESPHNLWDSFVSYSGNYMKTGCEITPENLPDYIKCRLSRIRSAPKGLSREQEEEILLEDPLALVVMNLIGGWDEKNPGDIKIVQKFIDKTYPDGFTIWSNKIREAWIKNNSMITFKDGIWILNDRKLHTHVTKNISDRILDTYSEFILEIAKERDPELDLLPEQRLLESMYGKTKKFSPTLRKYSMEGLAILANNKDMLAGCSNIKKDNFADNIVHLIME